MTFEKQFVEAKLNELRNYIIEAVDIMIDINQHFIKELKFPVSDDFQSTFYILGDNNVLPKEFADRVAPIAGIRNRIVHGYETLNRRQFLKDLRASFDDFKTYVKHILEYSEQYK